MSIDTIEFDRIADLARLEFSEQEKNEIVAEMERMIQFMEKLNELDVSGIEPTYHVLDFKNVFRQDRVGKSMPLEETLSNAPNVKQVFFSVPKVIS